MLSDDNGKTFQRWCAYLGGKSVNGTLQAFPMEEAVPYHIYYKVLNAKDFGVPQNRERVFIVGVRDDEDNNFRFPKEEFLTKRLKDILQKDINSKDYLLSNKAFKYVSDDKRIKKKYTQINGEIALTLTAKGNSNWTGDFIDLKPFYLSDDYLKFLDNHKNRHNEKGTGFGVEIKNGKDIATTLRANASLCPTDNHLKILPKPCKFTFHTCGNNNEVFCNSCEDGNNYEFLQGSDEGRIRRLTPRECFRLMDFPDTFDFSVVSNSQAYKQAGNSIVVGVLAKIIKNLNL